MESLVTLLIVVGAVAVGVWLIQMLPLPPKLEILRTILLIIIVAAALMRVWTLL